MIATLGAPGLVLVSVTVLLMTQASGAATAAPTRPSDSGFAGSRQVAQMTGQPAPGSPPGQPPVDQPPGPPSPCMWPPALNVLGVWAGTASCPQQTGRPFTITITDQTGNVLAGVLPDNSLLRGTQEGDQVSLEAPWGQRWVGRVTPAERGLRMEGSTFAGANPTGCRFELSKP